MATQPIGYSAYGSTKSQLSKTSGQTGTQESSRQSGSETTSWKGQIQAQVEALLADIPKGPDGKLSFKEVDEYREKLQEEWDKSVKEDLAKLGVNTDVELPFAFDPVTGKLTVSNSHPDKDKINQYFESNPDKVNEFIDIIQLGKLTQTAKSKLSPAQVRQNIQKTSMAIWYEDNSDPTSWFSGGGLLMNSSVNGLAFSGLNITV